jgi:hypothetical protein
MDIFTFVYQTIMATRSTFLYPRLAQDCGNLIVSSKAKETQHLEKKDV